jgi:hypothetical protein
MDNLKYMDNRGFMFEKASETIVDLTDGYLSNKNNVQYVESSSEDLLFGGLDDDGAEDDKLGSRLLSTLSTIHSIILDRTVSDQNKKRNLERLEKFNTLASKLSDKYAQADSMYGESFHQDVIDICESIQVAHNNLN